MKKVSRYVIIGIVLTLINFVLYTLISRLLIKNNDLLWLATLISSTISTIVAFFLHSKFTWQTENFQKIHAIKFFIWNLIEAIVINPFLTWIFAMMKWLYDFAFSVCQAISLPFDYDFVESTGAFALVTIITMILNYLFYDRFVFGKKEPKDAK